MTASKAEVVDAPIINEFPICLECKFIEYQDNEYGCGVIGKVVNVTADESVMVDGKIDISKVNAIAFDPYTHGYYKVTERVGVRMAKRAGLLHDIGKSIDHEVEGSHIQIGADLCKKYKESPLVINAVEAHHGDVEPESLIACIVQAADTISAARPGARRETLETYTNRLKQLEDITNSFKGVDKSFAIQAGREIRIMVVPEQVSDADMVLLARDIAKQIEAELEYPGQIKVNVIRESRAVDYAK